MNLSERVIIITGAGAGIGLGIARQCREAGANIVGFDINNDGADKLREIGAEFEQVDVADPDAFGRAIKNVYQQKGHLDGLVNNAGVTIRVPFLDMSHEQMETLWAINQRSVLVGCQAAARIMKTNNGGSIVNIASNHARCTNPGFEGYAGTKGAVVSMTRAMAWSLGPFKIRVNALCPGMTRTEIVQDAMQDPANEANFRSWAADNEVNSVEEVGNAAVFLLSSASAALNGADIIADRAMSALLGVMDSRGK
ncbi:SDR family oxidoreductase [Ahrensia kielensis]|uniref:SDR family oxidoreductase n=1 Tax=Ahrensia kielensis TaxID=76980 RepID=A0ABU9TBP7_9HYPH